jgi:hypothetical protein
MAIFGWDMLDIPIVMDWNKIGDYRQSLMIVTTCMKTNVAKIMVIKVETKYSLPKMASSTKQSPNSVRNHGLSWQFIQMDLSGFNVAANQNGSIP